MSSGELPASARLSTNAAATTLAGGRPILALDMYEHSYHIDYGAKAAAYVDAFMAAINWPIVGRAYTELRL
jgi:superoxide dismutase, Fe-Mn family